MTDHIAINANCPWSGDPVSNDALTTYRGRPVGFCNPGCRDKFDSATSVFDTAIGDPSRDPALQVFARFARYNQWFNERLLKRISRLRPADYRRDLGAFFGSVETTLNHIMVWDIVWLQRVALAVGEPECLAKIVAIPLPTSNDQIMQSRRPSFAAQRRRMDESLVIFIEELEPGDLSARIRYRRQSGAAFEHSMAEVLHHMFNHQTHHRGQITTMLSQLGIDPGVTDMVAMLIDDASAGGSHD